jgi:hypothetical protein
VAVFEPVVVNEAHEARAQVGEGQVRQEERESASDKGVGEGKGDKAAYEKQWAKGD